MRTNRCGEHERKGEVRSNGQVTVEYAVCTGLLGALAIGGLILLGGNVNTLLQAPAQGQASMQIDHLYNLVGASVKGSNAGANANGSPVKLQLSIDPVTGQVITTDTTGGSKNTTSVPGDQAMLLMAQQMTQLANVQLANGQPLPSNIQKMILQLMQDGVTLSNGFKSSSGYLSQFDAINAANAGKTSGLTSYPSTMITTLGANLSQSMQFQQDYNTLSGMLATLAKTDPSVVNTLINPLSELAGGITSIQYQNLGKDFANNFNPAATSSTDLFNIYTQSPSLQTAVPPSTMMQTFALPPDQFAPAVQTLISGAAASAVVGSPPSAGSPVDLTLNFATGGTSTQTGSISGSVSSGTTQTSANTSTSISISNSGIQASTTSTP